MTLDTLDTSLETLRKAYGNKNLTLYLGAGVSVDNGLPTWEKLVLAMYFSKISEQSFGGWRPFSNYLFAIAEWHLANSSEPLDITARKLRKYYDSGSGDEEEFLKSLYQTLYGGFLDTDRNGEPFDYIDNWLLRDANTTLDAVAKLCESPNSNQAGIRAVISYNYDDLLEIALGDFPYHSIFRPTTTTTDKLPIYHVHGFVPLRKDADRSEGHEIVFTEDQYHRVARDPYYWSNLIQLQSMSGSVGLMIGLSLSDRNIRRLLDAVKNAPIDSDNFALLKTPDKTPPEAEILDDIHEKAKSYLEKFERSGIKSDQGSEILFQRPGLKSERPTTMASRNGVGGPRYRGEIAGIIKKVKKLDLEQQEYVLQQLGITPIWFSQYSEIPGILEQIL